MRTNPTRTKPTHGRGWALLILPLLASAVMAAPDTAPPPRAAAARQKAVAPAPRLAKSLPWTVTDGQEVVVFAPHRPVRVRLNILFEGKPVAEMWRDKLRGAFDFFDRGKDGFLDAKEVQNVFSDSGMNLMLQNGFYQVTPNDRPSLERLDADKDGRVSFHEYLLYYRASTEGLLRSVPTQPENPVGAAATAALFKLMDGNGDGKLTRDEVKAVEKLLATQDADEDECLSQNELVPNVNANRGRGVQVLQNEVAVQQAPQPTGPQVVATYEAGRVPGTLTQEVIRRYDADGDFDLTREEVGFDEATFLRLDRDGSGKLDGEELDAWRTGPADLEVLLSLSPKAVDCVARLVTDEKTAAARGFTAKQVESGRMIVRTGRQPIEFWAYAAVLAGRPQPLRVQYQYLFAQAAGDKGFVLDKDLAGPNAVQFQFIRTLFDQTDTNGDGKMTREEFDAFFDLQDSFRNVALSLTPAVQTPTLFQLLDENGDGKLGVRELRTAWDRLLPLEPGSGEVITKAAIMPGVSLRLSRSAERFFVTQQQAAFQDPNRVVVPQKGPVWFRRMDRNADGDVSRSEFLGTGSEFDAIDTDRDGLISLAEAEAFDKKTRGKDEKK